MNRKISLVLGTLIACTLLVPALGIASHPGSRTDQRDAGSRTCDTSEIYNVIKSGSATSYLLIGLQAAGHLTLTANLTNIPGSSGIGCWLELRITSVQFTGASPAGTFTKNEGNCYALGATCQATSTVDWSIVFPGTARVKVNYDLRVSTDSLGNAAKSSFGSLDYADPSLPEEWGIEVPISGVGTEVPYTGE